MSPKGSGGLSLGSCHLWGNDLAGFRDEVRSAAELGFETIAIGDSPAGWRELGVTMAVAALEAPDALVTSFVTSPFVRHPLITANAICSVSALNGGRVALGLSTGGSNVMAIGRRQATQAQIRDYLQALRSLFAGEPATYAGRPVSPLRHSIRVPIYYSAFGPKALQLAGEQADGVILFVSDDLEQLDRKLELVRGGASAAGRDPDEIDVWATSYTSIRDSRAAALDDLKAFLVVNGVMLKMVPGLMDNVPEEFHAPLDELSRRYDPTEHVVADGGNAQLVDELGLLELLGRFDTIAGTAEHVSGVLDGLAARGVSTFIATLPGHADKLGTLQRLSALLARSTT